MTNKYLVLILTSGVLGFFTSLSWGQANTTPEVTFACADNQGVPITVAQNSAGKTQTIFHWKNNASLNLLNLQTLCTEVSEKLNDYAVEGNDLSRLGFGGEEQVGLPTICVTGENGDCNLILFTLAPAEKPIFTSNKVLTEILDPKIIDNQIQRPHRDYVSFDYQFDLLQLFQD